MSAFLDLEPKYRRAYIAKLIGCNPDQPDSWPLTLVDAIIRKAEHAADEAIRDEARRLIRR